MKDLENVIIIDDKNVKMVKSDTYNFIFDKRNGQFARWGKQRRMILL